MAPTARATRLSHIPSRNSAAPRPRTSILANELKSNSAAASRQARGSASIAGDQSLPAQPRGRSASSPRAALGSHPLARYPASADVRRPEDELAGGRERLRTVDQPDHLRVEEGGNPEERGAPQLVEALPVLLEQLPVEVGRDAVEGPRAGPALVPAHQQTARLAPEVDEQRRVAQRRHSGRQPARPGHQILVRHWDDRDVDPRQSSDFGSEDPP